MFLLYHFVPGGTNVFIVTLCALRPKMLETCDPEGSGVGSEYEAYFPVTGFESGFTGF